MADGSPDGAPTPLENDRDEQVGEQAADEDEEDGSGNDSEGVSRPSTPARGRSAIPQKRRAGRPAKTRLHDRSGRDENESRDAASDTGTPRKRGGWRGGVRGSGVGRWGKPRGGPSHVTQVPLDKEGNMANVKDDEVELPEDPEGENKVDKMGRLQGDREYRVRVFTISGKGDRLYMLSTEPARCIGFRDSYLFFQKHRSLYKIILGDEAKRDLIERSLIPHSYKGRAIGVVTARSVFREFGAQIIIGGKKITDDYQATDARARGDIEGKLAVPEDRAPVSGDSYDKNRYVAWHGASSVYHSGAPSLPLPSGKVADGKKKKVVVTGDNWMFEHAQAARWANPLTFNSLLAHKFSSFNSKLAQMRRQSLEGAYDPHTNVMQYPKIMQPTHGRWEQLPTGPASSIPLSYDQRRESVNLPAVDSMFPDVAPVFTHNFAISDTYYVSPLYSGLGIPGPDGPAMDVGPGGLTEVPQDIVAALPDENRQAFEEMKLEEIKWKLSWGGEDEDRARAKLRISYNT